MVNGVLHLYLPCVERQLDSFPTHPPTRPIAQAADPISMIITFYVQVRDAIRFILRILIVSVFLAQYIDSL